MTDIQNKLDSPIEVLTDGDKVKVMCDFMILVDILETLEEVAISQELLANRYRLRALEWSKCDSMIIDIARSVRKVARHYGVYKSSDKK